MDYYEIGQRIRRVRKAKGISQEQMAEAALARYGENGQ